MKVNLLNVQISIEKNRVEVDSIGNHKPLWESYYTCYPRTSCRQPHTHSCRRC